MKIKNPIILSTLILVGFGLIGSTIATVTYYQTLDKIAANERQALLSKLMVLIPPDKIDNDLLVDKIEINAPSLSPQKSIVYRARKNNQPIAAIFTPIVPDGYAGEIKLLVAVNIDGTLAGVRVVSHQETPGLGDRIEEKKSDWITKFAGKFLGDPPLERWLVKKDGGEFDAFTGATITPRSIVKQVKNTLLYYQQYQQVLFQ